MNKKFLAGSILGFFVLVGVAMFFVSGQFSPGSEVTALYLYGAQPINSNNTCMAGSSPCIDTDTGYAPTIAGAIASSVVPMTSYVSGGINYWNVASYNYQCVVTTELCDTTTGDLLEVVCGNAIGIPNGAAFNAAFAGNQWVSLFAEEPVALMRVNCATYAANNPSLGLAGTCSAGACI